MNPKIKLVVIIREPVKRTISTFVHLYGRRLFEKGFNYQKHFEFQIFEKNKTIIIDDEFCKVKRRKSVTFINDGLYVVHLRKWLNFFPLNQILFVNGEQFIRNPYKEIKKIESFLQLESFIQPEHFVFNTEKIFYCINKSLFNSTEDQCLGSDKGREHPKLDNKVLEKLKEFYKPYSIELFEMIKEKPFWEI